MCVCDIVFLMNLRMVVFQNTVLRLTAPAFKLNSLSPPPTLNIQHKINGCVAVRTTTPAQLSPGFGDYHNPGKLDALYENSLGFSAF